ncbi:PAS domain-containing sensor histidine kinase [Roseateles albus]|uniref:histidine kinase n=1 Tax=Roseateles albus TaxID=2987525 RepID=A0ABT5KI27_9BURK|nr:PAS domain S-box protein [Roseateles albus]MDC8773042.1 PAS domain S-box protein [Roseateles albus]
MDTDSNDVQTAGAVGSQKTVHKFRQLADWAPVSLALFDLDMRYLELTQGWRDDCQLGDRNVIGLSHYEVFPDLPARWKDVHRRCLAGATERSESDIFLRPDGTLGWIRWEVKPWRDDSSNIGGIVMWTEDITVRKQMEDTLHANKERLKFLLSSSPAIIYTCEVEPPYAATYISENIIDLMGFQPEQFTDAPNFWAAHIHPEDSQLVFDQLGELFAHGHHAQEYRFQMADGTYHWVYDRAKVVYSNDGKPDQLIGYWADINEKKLAEAELRRSEASHRELFDSNPHPMWVFDRDTLAFIAVNDAAICHYGYSRDEFLAMTIKDIRPPEDLPRLLDNLALEWDGIDEAGLWNHCTKDGRVITVEIVSHALKFAGRNAELVLAHDVTKRNQAEIGLQTALREKTALLLEVHHRVKNNLQVITSLLRLEGFRCTDDPTKAVLQDMQQRVRSMALLHEIIYRKGTFAAVDLGSYLGQIAGESLKSLHAGRGTVQLRLDLGLLKVGLDQATPAGLLVSELVSNSLKHAFPDERSGEITISLHPLDLSDHWRLAVIDNGIGLPADFETRRESSLGLQLVADLASQMGGKLQVGHGPQAAFTIDFIALEPKALVINLNGDLP